MKTLKLIIAALVSLPLQPAEAALGETPEQCIKRYGTPTFKERDGTPKSFSMGGLVISTRFENSKCNLIWFRPEPARVLSDAELRALLDASKGGSEWKSADEPGQKKWVTADGKRRANYASGGVLLIAEEAAMSPNGKR